MLAARVAAGVLARAHHGKAEPAIAFALLEQRLPEAQQPVEAARRHQRRRGSAPCMRRPVLVMTVLARHEMRRRVEILPRLPERGAPRIVAARDRAAQRQAFQFDAGVGHVSQVGQRQRRHAKAALILHDDQPVGDEARQRLAHRDRADREPLCERADQKLLARLGSGRRARRPATEIDGRGERPRPALEARKRAAKDRERAASRSVIMGMLSARAGRDRQ